MGTFISNSPESTLAFGESWAARAKPGWVIALRGDLGAGKTQWVKGFARGLGFAGRVASPTFALIQSYAGGRHPLFHLDLYRLASETEIVAAGLDEFLFNPPGIAVVEWPERWLGGSAQGELPASWRRFCFKQTGERDRLITYEDPEP
ncbi:MAG: tRNA (adenosine(37)-N6)-threonylcarbamoyltransferase complex ATPase subunit type 1 TsaE [Verrucomicrobia bacterium]|nr:tRNA (adenosine(37)-N6)-threonylcarbamoyltransferase complex ATPase subunit type 1 TsaE [Verrucomicrobiota bacterium]MBI3869432.1 tRNA (adenosine(37)-N6)-threonylcarbamoyltransferase complex ATPase subunit type 1 TsaE [Verrucomicrobiota bacterium]